MGPIKPWVNRHWILADVYWDYAKRTPYYEEISGSDPTETMAFKFKMEQRIVILFLRKFRIGSRGFNFIQNAAWYYSKIAGRFTVL